MKYALLNLITDELSARTAMTLMRMTHLVSSFKDSYFIILASERVYLSRMNVRSP